MATVTVYFKEQNQLMTLSYCLIDRYNDANRTYSNVLSTFGTTFRNPLSYIKTVSLKSNDKCCLTC